MSTWMKFFICVSSSDTFNSQDSNISRPFVQSTWQYMKSDRATGIISVFWVSQTCHLTAAWGWFSRIHWYSEKLVCNRLLSRTMHAPSVLITQCSLAEKTRGNQQVNSFHYPRHYENGKALLYIMLLSVPCHLYDSLLTGCLFRSYDTTSGLRFYMPCCVNLSQCSS